MLPVLLIEPASSGKRRHFTEILREPRTQLQLSLEDVKRRLSEVRSYTLDHLDALAGHAVGNAVARHPTSRSAYPPGVVVIPSLVRTSVARPGRLHADE
jgi:hypothetical protein